MNRSMIMGLVALGLIFFSVPTQLLILGIYAHSVGAVIVCILLALLVGAIGINLTSIAFEAWDSIRSKKKKPQGLHGRRSAARIKS